MNDASNLLLEPGKNAELDLRERELKLKDAELQLRQRELDFSEKSRANGWLKNPIFLAITGGVIAIVTGIVTTGIQQKTNSDIEKYKSQSNLILEAMKTGSPQTARNNIKFFLDLGYIDDPTGKVASAISASNAPQNTIAANLPTASSPVVSRSASTPTPMPRPHGTPKPGPNASPSATPAPVATSTPNVSIPRPAAPIGVFALVDGVSSFPYLPASGVTQPNSPSANITATKNPVSGWDVHVSINSNSALKIAFVEVRINDSPIFHANLSSPVNTWDSVFLGQGKYPGGNTIMILWLDNSGQQHFASQSF